ncbi:MAG: LytTR family DNA-binding domain-containing protein [Bacteroidetes bacterium]|nr:LytTR family DNA-binding domain-containing protein [Bacteroidota bacterium]
MISCIVVDDDPLALELLTEYISRVNTLQMKGTFSDPFEAARKLKDDKADLIFLDVIMPGLNGIQLLKTLKNPPMVIFVTAFREYAVEGFALDAVDYLVKPVEFERFVRAVNKAEEIAYASSGANLYRQDFIFIKSEYQLLKINYRDIEYIEGLDDYLKIYCGGKPILSLMNLKAIQLKLPSSQFVRVHRSYIVSIAKIESVQRNKIKIRDKLIPISDGYIDEFHRIIGF